MKKWLAACLLAIALLFVTTTAMAGHTKKNGDYCLGGSYALLKEYEKQHLRRCNDCREELLEDHFVGNADSASCIVKKKCGGCTQPLGWGDHDWGDWESNGNGTHTRTCKRLGTHTEMEKCTFSVAPCTEPAACTECGASYKLGGHDWGGWTPNGDKTHTHVCTRDPSHTETEDCGDFWEADCTTPAMCWYCRGTYGETDPNQHGWDMWESNGDGTHTRICYRERSHTETEDCFGVSCGETDWCNGCWEIYTASHKFDDSWSTTPDEHWKVCLHCKEIQNKALHSFVEQPDEKHLKSEATCASPAKYLGTCSDCGFYRTYNLGDIDPNNHDLIHHEAKAATCTQPGWEAYDTCSRCDYTTYVELTNGGHSLTHHAAKAPTCTEPGWNAYDTCSRCDYTTYVELPALGHDYQEEVIPRTCEQDGFTLHTCLRCGDDYTDNMIGYLGHWYGEWTANGDGTQRAECLRGGCHHEKTVDCEIIELPALNISLCPVCGTVSDGSKPTLANASVKIISGRIPHGEALLRVGTLANGEKLLTVGYVYGGRLSKASCQVRIALPAGLVNGYTLSLLNADGTETAVDCTVDGESAVFTLDFAQSQHDALLLRLIPVA